MSLDCAWPTWTVPEAQEYLCALPGVGRKTAACVLLFALGMRDVPVDTHVSRVGTRLELFRPGAPFEELHDTMLAITPPGEELELHLNLLRHGRRTCHARRPECRACALRRMCPSADSFGRALLGLELRHRRLGTGALDRRVFGTRRARSRDVAGERAHLCPFRGVCCGAHERGAGSDTTSAETRLGWAQIAAFGGLAGRCKTPPDTVL